MRWRLILAGAGVMAACLLATGAVPAGALGPPLPSPPLPPLPPLPLLTPTLPPLPSPSLPPLPLPTPSLPVPQPPVPSPPPLPIPTPTLPLPTPSLPVPTPSLPGVLPLPTPSPAGPGVGTLSTPGPADPRAAVKPGGSDPSSQAKVASRGPVTVINPWISLPPGPVGTVIALVLMFLPLLAGIWLLALARTVMTARQVADSALRLNVAADLGVPPRELAGMSAAALLKIRDEIAFDELTGVMRRASGIAVTERKIARAKRQKEPMVAAFVDVDGLKHLNDTEGHAAGDALLRDVATSLKDRLRGEDIIFRYGGDEFVCLLSGSKLEDAIKVFEDCLAIAARKGRFFSYGAAEYRDGDDPVSLLGRADGALYDRREARRAAGEQVAWREGPRERVSL